MRSGDELNQPFVRSHTHYRLLAIDSRRKLRKTDFGIMKSRRHKPGKEIEEFLRQARLDRESDAAFREQLRKAAAAMVEEETVKISRSERPTYRKPLARHLRRPVTAGLLLLVAGAVVGFSLPVLGWAAIICGLGAILWGYFSRPGKH